MRHGIGETMKWIPVGDGGCVNAAYVVRIVRDVDGSILHLTDGTTVRSFQQFDVVDGQLTVIEPDDDDDLEDDDTIPF
jgi:hypothetical protein